MYEIDPALRTHVVYAVRFSDDRIKVGITANAKKRMSYYAQEAPPNRVNHLVWWACAPTFKRFAMIMEKHLCSELRPQSIPGHREWFIGDTEEFGVVVKAIEIMREKSAMKGEVVEELPFRASSGQKLTWCAQ